VKSAWADGLLMARRRNRRRQNACVAKAFECGINFFDTANAYNCGEGEKAVGAALRSYTRSDYVLSTKVFFPMGDGVNDRRWLISHLQDKHLREENMSYCVLIRHSPPCNSICTKYLHLKAPSGNGTVLYCSKPIADNIPLTICLPARGVCWHGLSVLY
jgi:diketogulonate reductase-like aldo/keto reductase